MTIFFLTIFPFKIFEEINKPSFIFLHGLPARMNNFDDNRTKYLIVWGEKIKDAYVNMGGFDPNKIFVSGNRNYKNYNTKELKFDFTDIVVLTCSMPGGQNTVKIQIIDRG